MRLGWHARAYEPSSLHGRMIWMMFGETLASIWRSRFSCSAHLGELARLARAQGMGSQVVRPPAMMRAAVRSGGLRFSGPALPLDVCCGRSRAEARGATAAVAAASARAGA